MIVNQESMMKCLLLLLFPSPNTVVEYMLKLSGLKAGEVLFDMGSGDGRTVIMAAKTFGARGVGIELREDLAKKSMSNIHEMVLTTARNHREWRHV